jgi:hypothetical protein
MTLQTWPHLQFGAQPHRQADTQTEEKTDTCSSAPRVVGCAEATRKLSWSRNWLRKMLHSHLDPASVTGTNRIQLGPIRITRRAFYPYGSHTQNPEFSTDHTRISGAGQKQPNAFPTRLQQSKHATQSEQAGSTQRVLKAKHWVGAPSWQS